jgi:hypothetical protein
MKIKLLDIIHFYGRFFIPGRIAPGLIGLAGSEFSDPGE